MLHLLQRCTVLPNLSRMRSAAPTENTQGDNRVSVAQNETEKNSSQIIFVVDDDQDMLRLVSAGLNREGFKVETYVSAAEFLKSFKPEQRGCLLLDVEMPGLSGLELQQDLLNRLIDLPIIFLTANADVPTAVKAIKRGALDLLQKPFELGTLVVAVTKALESDRRRSTIANRSKILQHRRGRLTPREKEVMDLVVLGHSNKKVAALLNLSSKTVEIHRARVMRKMEADSLADLVRLSIEITSGTGGSKGG